MVLAELWGLQVARSRGYQLRMTPWPSSTVGVTRFYCWAAFLFQLCACALDALQGSVLYVGLWATASLAFCVKDLLAKPTLNCALDAPASAAHRAAV